MKETTTASKTLFVNIVVMFFSRHAERALFLNVMPHSFSLTSEIHKCHELVYFKNIPEFRKTDYSFLDSVD